VGKSLSRTFIGAGHEVVAISGGSSSIPNGTLYVCTLTVAAGVANGSYAVASVPATSDASSNALPTSGSDGVLHISSCGADCNGDQQVKINEVSRTSALFLGNPFCNANDFLLSCPNADTVFDSDHEVKINEVSRASCLYLNGICSRTCP
jgi:hypothetical protein